MQPYMNPYYFQNNPAFQQQSMYNPMAPYQERLNQMQAQYNQPQMVQQNQAMSLNGEIVDSIDVVKAKNVDMSGQPTFYPKSDLSEVYVKRLMADGTSQIITFKAMHPEETKEQKADTSNTDILNQLFSEMKQDIMQEISSIKEMIPKQEKEPENTNPPKIQKGGWPK